MAEMRIFKQIPRILFGEGSLEEIVNLFPGEKRKDQPVVYVIDDVLESFAIHKRLPTAADDIIHWFPASKHEPKTIQIDQLKVETTEKLGGKKPRLIVGVGGGSTMDVAKALSIVLENEGATSAYQGWDKVEKKAVPKIGVPTLAGSGAEASRTAVLSGPQRKQGINSDESMFDSIVLDSSLLWSVPKQQKFFSGMDCYIHCVESLQGSMINELAHGYASKGVSLCQKVFLDGGDDNELMVSSFFGGASIVNSEVGVCHALSYGLSSQLGFRHGQANCIAFQALEEVYGDSVRLFRDMSDRWDVSLPERVCANLSDPQMELMIESTLAMERPLENAFGPEWRKVMTRDRIEHLYNLM